MYFVHDQKPVKDTYDCSVWGQSACFRAQVLIPEFEVLSLEAKMLPKRLPFNFYENLENFLPITQYLERGAEAIRAQTKTGILKVIGDEIEKIHELRK